MLELRQKIRDMIQAGRLVSTSASARAAPRKASPHQGTPMEEEPAVSAVAVLQFMSSVEERIAADKSGPPGEPGNSFDELCDWSPDDSGVLYWVK